MGYAACCRYCVPAEHNTNVFLMHVCDKGKSRGYGFVEFEHKKDMKEAYKQADGRKIEGRRVVVDVERGRTVENW